MLIVGIAVIVLFIVWVMSQPAPPEAHEGATNWEAYKALIRNPAHIMLELTLELITAFILWPVGKFLWDRAVEKHDREYHDH